MARPRGAKSSGNYEIVTSARPHAGGESAELCGYLTCRDEISQTVKLPAHSKKVVFSYWAFVSGTSCSDTFSARLRTTSGAIIATPGKLCGTHAAGWTHYTFDVTSALASFAGKSVAVSFNANTTASTVGDFFVDDIALNVTPAYTRWKGIYDGPVPDEKETGPRGRRTATDGVRTGLYMAPLHVGETTTSCSCTVRAALSGDWDDLCVGCRARRTLLPWEPV